MKKEEYSLVYKAIHGDSHAYGELIHQYNPYFYHFTKNPGCT